MSRHFDPRALVPVLTDTCPFLRFCSIQLLRDIKSFFSTTFKITPLSSSAADDEEEDAPAAAYGKEYQLSCLGIGHSNVSKGVA